MTTESWPTKTVKYKGRHFELRRSFLKFYNYYKARLFLKKLKRILKRAISYANLIPVVLVSLAVITLIVYFWRNMNNFLDAMWEVKTVIFTSIIITYFTSAATQEFTRHRNLLIRHEIYFELMNYFEYMLNSIANLLGFSYDTDSYLYTKKRFNNVIDQIKNNKYANKLGAFKRKQLKLLIERLYVGTENYKNALISYIPNSEIWEINFSFSFLTSNINVLLCMSDDVTIVENTRVLFDELMHDAFNIVEKARHPWRVDFDLNSNILLLLYYTNNEQILNEYYLSRQIDISEAFVPPNFKFLLPRRRR